MTIMKAAKNGITINCDAKPHRWGDVTVFFYNTANKREDSTSFDVENPLCPSGLDELNALYKDFCREENIPTNTVSEICLEHTAETYDELMQIC